MRHIVEKAIKKLERDIKSSYRDKMSESYSNLMTEYLYREAFPDSINEIPTHAYWQVKKLHKKWVDANMKGDFYEYCKENSHWFKPYR